jgi:Rrf2 family nitric oxide-sensitive transcriptional repressor
MYSRNSRQGRFLMRLTTYTDYALRVMMYLALKHEGGCVVTIDEMAAAYGISRNHLMKIVNELSQHGFIETVRGRFGGARLARPPAQIQIGTLVRAMEKDFSPAACHDAANQASCTILPACNLRHGLKRAMEAFLRELDRMTLADAITTPRLAAPVLRAGARSAREVIVPMPRRRAAAR